MESAPCSGPFEKIPPAPRTNQIAGFLNSARSRAEKKTKVKVQKALFRWPTWATGMRNEPGNPVGTKVQALKQIFL